MKGTLAVIILLAVLSAAAILLRPKTNETSPIQPKQPTDQSLSPTAIPTYPPSSTTDLPLLYPGLEWGEVEEVEIVAFNPNTYNGYRVESQLLDVYPSQFIDYYFNTLFSNNWKLLVDASEGPMGDFYGFGKGDRHLFMGVYKYPDREQYQAFIEYD
jgi:hypothetical protein